MADSKIHDVQKTENVKFLQRSITFGVKSRRRSHEDILDVLRTKTQTPGTEDEAFPRLRSHEDLLEAVRKKIRTPRTEEEGTFGVKSRRRSREEILAALRTKMQTPKTDEETFPRLRSHEDLLEAVRIKLQSPGTEEEGTPEVTQKKLNASAYFKQCRDAILQSKESPKSPKSPRSREQIVKAIRQKLQPPHDESSSLTTTQRKSASFSFNNKSRRSYQDIIEAVRSKNASFSTHPKHLAKTRSFAIKSRTCQMNILDSIGTRIDDSPVLSERKRLGSLSPKDHEIERARVRKSPKIRREQWFRAIHDTLQTGESETLEASILQRRLPTTPANPLPPDHVRYSKQSSAQQIRTQQLDTLTSSERDRLSSKYINSSYIRGGIFDTPQADESDSAQTDDFDESDIPKLAKSFRRSILTPLQIKSIRLSLSGALSSDHLETCCHSMQNTVQKMKSMSISLSRTSEELIPSVTATRSRARAESAPFWVSFNSKRRVSIAF